MSFKTVGTRLDFSCCSSNIGITVFSLLRITRANWRAAVLLQSSLVSILEETAREYKTRKGQFRITIGSFRRFDRRSNANERDRTALVFPRDVSFTTETTDNFVYE